ncbi:MAG: IS66 family transposase [Solirubrobacteraceae bacterium]
MILGVTGVPPADELAVLAEVQGALIEVLESRNAELESRNGELSGRVAELEERLARLERLLSRNSGNSSMAPSADDLPGKTPPAAKPKRGDGKKRQGKQRGAPGAHLAWSEDPDERKPLFPRGACGCGQDLADAEDVGISASHQVIDTPVVTATVTQYDEHAVACRCGRVHVAPPPAGAGQAGAVTYGLNLQAWAVFLLVVHHVPVERCAGVIAALTGTRPSDGFVHAMIARAAEAVRGANMLIRALVITAAVLCADETPLRVGPGPKSRKKYLLVACTGLLTYYFLGDRSMKTFDAFVFPDLSGTVLVHDRYQNYDAIPGVLHQLCTQHILRDLEDAAQSCPDAVWPGQAAEALRALIHAANLSRARGLAAAPDSGTAADLRFFRNAVRVGLSQVRRVPGANTKQRPGRMLLECLKDREDDVLRFLTDLRIPPTSNQAERDLRPSKTQQKISGRLRSETATRNRYAIRGYLDTARKHGQPVITATRDALAGNPWMPPLPA